MPVEGNPNSSPNDNRASIAHILSPKRNLGFELSQVMNRSLNSLNWESNDSWKQLYKQDSRVNTLEMKLDEVEFLDQGEQLKTEEICLP